MTGQVMAAGQKAWRLIRYQILGQMLAVTAHPTLLKPQAVTSMRHPRRQPSVSTSSRLCR